MSNVHNSSEHTAREKILTEKKNLKDIKKFRKITLFLTLGGYRKFIQVSDFSKNFFNSF